MEREEGFTRLGYSEEEWESIAAFIQEAQALGLAVIRDAAGNAIARWEGMHSEAGAVAMGSHLDTVKNGGGYDGVAGVLCGLGAVKALKEENYRPVVPVEVICFASEESSRFGVSTIGSKAMTGNWHPEMLRDVTDTEGITVRQAVEERGLSFEQMEEARRPCKAIRHFVELHIEQGTRIEEAGKDFGVATAVACPIRLRIRVVGKAGHTGSTPMSRRWDALVASAPLISFISERARQLSEENDVPVVATVSQINLTPNVITVIPEEVVLGIDIRSVNDCLKRSLADEIQEKMERLADEDGVSFTVETLVDDDSVKLDPDLSTSLQQMGQALGYEGLMMESGAGHDVMNMAARWSSGLIFIPCRDGLSHHPKEYASPKDLQMGVELLKAYIRQYAGEQ